MNRHFSLVGKLNILEFSHLKELTIHISKITYLFKTTYFIKFISLKVHMININFTL